MRVSCNHQNGVLEIHYPETTEMNRATTILLYILGIMLVMAAVIVLLRGFGLISVIPEHVIWALILLAVGAGILGGLRSAA
jgi:hypothetical protein